MLEESSNPQEIFELARLFGPSSRLPLLTYFPTCYAPKGQRDLTAGESAGKDEDVFKLNRRIHSVLSFLPRCVVFVIGGSGRGKEPSRENVLRLIQIRFTTVGVLKKYS